MAAGFDDVTSVDKIGTDFLTSYARDATVGSSVRARFFFSDPINPETVATATGASRAR